MSKKIKLESPILIDIPNFSDIRGKVKVFESIDLIPFQIQRCYVLYDFNPNTSRGGHAHTNLNQAIHVLNGNLEITLSTPNKNFKFFLDNKKDCLIIPKGYWRTLKSQSSETIVLVLADKKYLNTKYIRDFDEYRYWFDHNVLG